MLKVEAQREPINKMTRPGPRRHTYVQPNTKEAIICKGSFELDPTPVAIPVSQEKYPASGGEVFPTTTTTTTSAEKSTQTWIWREFSTRIFLKLAGGGVGIP